MQEASADPAREGKIPRNLRHLRLFLAVCETGSLTRAAARSAVSQPAATQAVAALEAGAGGALFERTPAGMTPTPRGVLLAGRVGRLLARLDAALADIAPRLRTTATLPQLLALAAVAEAQGFAPAARRLGLAQPTLHRAVARLEAEAGRPLLERAPSGVRPSRRAATLARAVRLALAELDQAEAELRELDGGESGRIVVGALPLSRSVVLPGALAAFRRLRPTLPVTVIDGPYDEMLTGLCRGEIDVILGALRLPPPVEGLREERLFDDSLSIVARPGHPALAGGVQGLAALAGWGWVVPRQGTPTRAQFEAAFAAAGLAPPAGVIECGSILLMRELLARGTLLGCISARQAAAEVAHGLVAAVPLPGAARRPIGLTVRADWQPTRAQALFLDLVRAEASALAPAVGPTSTSSA